MNECMGVSKLLGKAKVDQVNEVSREATSDKDIVRLDVEVDDVTRMDKFQMRNLGFKHQKISI